MAGEMRRYWPFAATVAAGTGLGPAHPPICVVSETLTRRLPCVEVTLSTQRNTRLSDVLNEADAPVEVELSRRQEVPVVVQHVPAETFLGARISSEPAR
jgi:hypothetical protein